MKGMHGFLRDSLTGRHRTRICETASSVSAKPFPHLPQAGISVGDATVAVEEYQYGPRKPNEDAVSVP
jgi:hypothetical protein